MRNALLAALLLLAGVAYAEKAPVHNVNASHHPNLSEAQRLSHQAWERLEAAQKANEWDLGGHAKKAKELLEQANEEIKAAAETANHKK